MRYGLLMIGLLLLTERIRRKRIDARVFARQYVHPGHMWVRETREGDAMIGIDALAAGFIGEIHSVTLPHYLRKLHQGEPCCTIGSGRHAVTMVCPVSGRVVEKNEMAFRHPSLVAASPQGEGWLFKVHPSSFGHESKNLMTGSWAEVWADAARTRILRIAGGPALAFAQDGGRLRPDVSQFCSEAEWLTLRRELFLDDSPSDRAHAQKPSVSQKEVLS